MLITTYISYNSLMMICVKTLLIYRQMMLHGQYMNCNTHEYVIIIIIIATLGVVFHFAFPLLYIFNLLSLSLSPFTQMFQLHWHKTCARVDVNWLGSTGFMALNIYLIDNMENSFLQCYCLDLSAFRQLVRLLEQGIIHILIIPWFKIKILCRIICSTIIESNALGHWSLTSITVSL